MPSLFFCSNKHNNTFTYVVSVISMTKKKQTKERTPPMKHELWVKYTQDFIDENKGIPIGVRQVWYYMSTRLLVIPHTDQAYKNLDAHLVKAREDGKIDDEAFEDAERNPSGGDGYLSCPRDFWEDALRVEHEIKDYPRCYKMWDDQPKYIELWIEKKGHVALVSKTSRNYGVKVVPTKGNTSLTSIKKAVRTRWLPAVDNGKEIYVLCFGDFDASGVSIRKSLEERIFKYMETERPDSSEHLHFVDVCLNEEQVRDKAGNFLLPKWESKRGDKAKKDDPNWKKFYEQYPWLIINGKRYGIEIDALDPKKLSEIIQQSIEQHIDADIWNKTGERAERERDLVRKQYDENKHLFDELVEKLCPEE